MTTGYQLKEMDILIKFGTMECLTQTTCLLLINNPPNSVPEEIEEIIDPEHFDEDPSAPFPVSEANYNAIVNSPFLIDQENLKIFINS